MGQLVDLTNYAVKNAAQTISGLWTFSGGITSPGSGVASERFGASASTGTGIRNTAIGYGANVSSAATQAVAVGQNATVSVDNGVAVGYNASTTNGLAFGGQANASGSTSLAFGVFSVASGSTAAAICRQASATHNFSHVFGPFAASIADYGYVFGFGGGVVSIAPAFYKVGTSSTGVQRILGRDAYSWVASTDTARMSRCIVYAYDGNGATENAREAYRYESNGSAPLIGFLGATAVVRPTVTGSRGSNAALASLLTALASLGLVTDSSS